ncbi:hypothetical protein F2P79_012174 [Pimephales promelas]|nr:hypothetical protein F2P79_012174 [Pimephales promelas]
MWSEWGRPVEETRCEQRCARLRTAKVLGEISLHHLFICHSWRCRVSAAAEPDPPGLFQSITALEASRHFVKPPVLKKPCRAFLCAGDTRQTAVIVHISRRGSESRSSEEPAVSGFDKGLSGTSAPVIGSGGFRRSSDQTVGPFHTIDRLSRNELERQWKSRIDGGRCSKHRGETGESSFSFGGDWIYELLPQAQLFTVMLRMTIHLTRLEM